MVAPTADDRVVLRRQYQASPELVYDAWTQPEQMKQWFAPSDDCSNPFIEVDLREGGEYRIGFRSAEGEDAVVGGKYLIVQPPQKLSFTWQWESPHEFEQHETLVTVEFLGRDGGTELVLTHERFPNEKMLGLHDQGWNGTLDRLAKAVE